MNLSVLFPLLPLTALATILVTVWYLIEPGRPQPPGGDHLGLTDPITDTDPNRVTREVDRSERYPSRI